MANKKISELPAATTATGAEALVIQGGVNKRLPAELLGGAGGGGGASLSSANPSAPGTVNPGNSTQASRSDHVHPRDDGKLDVPNGTKAVGRVPTVQGDMSVAWLDPPAGGGGGASLGNTTPATSTTSGSAGAATTAARSDHSHPIDTSRMANPTGTKTPNAVPLVQSDGNAVMWGTVPTDTSRMANPTGTKASGRVPTVAGDGTTVTWTDPATGTSLVPGNNKLIGTDGNGNVTPLRGATSVAQTFEGAPTAGATKLYFTINAPWPGTLDGIAYGIEGSGSPSATVAIEKVASGNVGTVLGGLGALVISTGSRDVSTKAAVTGTRAFAAGETLRATVTAVSGTVTALAIELTLNRAAG